MQKLKIVVLEKNDDNQNGVSNYLKNCEEINLIGATVTMLVCITR